MTIGATGIKDLVQKLFGRFLKPNAPVVTEGEKPYEDARMSYTRLQALEGPGYRQCYMEKLREADNSHDAESKERWFSEPSPEPIDPVDEQLSKRKKQRILQAQQRMSYTRLQALAQQMPPEQRLLNDEEARRLGGVKMPPLDG